MASKPLIIASLIGASIGVPYVTSQTKTAASGDATVASPPAGCTATTAAAAPPVAAPPILPAATASAATPATPAAPVTLPSPRSPSAEQALRFDVTKEWVYRSWDRKTTAPTDVGLYAVRVPMVSGTQAASLAGSLTYFFNAQGQVEHISFRGRTGDPSRLVRFLMQSFQLVPVAAPTGEQLYQVADRSGIQSELRIRPESVANSTSPHGSHSVELELARPGSERYLPPRPNGLHIPQTPDAVQPPPTEAANSSAVSAHSTDAGGDSYFDRVRYANPQEASQVLWKRWPN
jgi:hypothetical protein